MERVLKPTVRFGVAAVATIVAGIAIYLFALLNVYLIGWAVQLLDWIF